jgi:hypothetical protein
VGSGHDRIDQTKAPEDRDDEHEQSDQLPDVRVTSR